MPDISSFAASPVTSTSESKSALCPCSVASSLRGLDAALDRSTRQLSLGQLATAVREESDNGRDSSYRHCPLLASHCCLLLLPAIERSLRDESEAVRSLSVRLLSQSAPLLAAAGLCPVCRTVPLLSGRFEDERAEDVRRALLDVLRESCLPPLIRASSACCHSGPPPLLPAVCSTLVAAMADPCPAVKRAAAECAALLPSALLSVDQCSLSSLSALVSSACSIVRQRLDVRKAAVAALAALVPFTATSERSSHKSTTSAASSSPAAAAVTVLSLPAAVECSADVLSSLSADPKLSVRSVWFECVSRWLLCGKWRRSAELWLLAELLVLLDDDDAELRAASLACLTAVSSRSGLSGAAWLSQCVGELLPSLLRLSNDWKASERLRGCRQLGALISHADSGSTSTHLDDMLPALCRYLLDDDRAARDKARAAINAGADKWTARCCIEAVQRTVVRLQQQQQQQSGQSEMTAAALMALDTLLAGASLSRDDVDGLLALLESLLSRSPVVSSSVHCVVSPSASSIAPLLSLMAMATAAVNSSTLPSQHSVELTQQCRTASCQPCRLFMALHSLDCCLQGVGVEAVDGNCGQQRECAELHEELAAVVRALDANSSMYVRCLPRLLASLGLPALHDESSSSGEEGLTATVIPPSLLLWLRRGVDVAVSHWRLVLPLWSGVMASHSLAEADRARVVTCVADFLGSAGRSEQLTGSQLASLIRRVLLPGCEWRPGVVNAVVRLHSLSCLHTALSHPSSADAAAECAAPLTERLLAVLRSHLDDEQAACRATALSCIRAIAVSARGAHIRRMDGTHATCSEATNELWSICARRR